MDIDTLLTIGLALAAVAGVVVAVVTRRKAGPRKVEDMRSHLETIGVHSVVATSAESNLSQIGHSWSEKHVGTLRVKGRTVEAINIVGVSSQYGTHYFLDLLVPVTPFGSVADPKKTRLVRKKRPALWGKTTDVEWQGDGSLSRRLNFDYQLRDSLKALDEDVLRGGVAIHAQRKQGWARVRTKYFLPSVHSFEAMDSICKHVRAEW